MSHRWTPVSLMTGDRYATWAERRTRQLKRERSIRYLGSIGIVVACIGVAVLALRLVLGSLP